MHEKSRKEQSSVYVKVYTYIIHTYIHLKPARHYGIEELALLRAFHSLLTSQFSPCAACSHSRCSPTIRERTRVDVAKASRNIAPSCLSLSCIYATLYYRLVIITRVYIYNYTQIL